MCVCVHTVIGSNNPRFVVASLKIIITHSSYFSLLETGLRRACLFTSNCVPNQSVFPAFFFLQHSFYFLMTAVCVCIGSAFCSTGCLKPTFSTAAGRVLHCFNLLQNGLIFLTENTGNNPQPLAPRNSGLSGICMNI